MHKYLFKATLHLVFVALISISSQAIAAPTKVLFTDSFESGGFSHEENSISWNPGGAQTSITSEIARSGSHSLKFHFQNGVSAGPERAWIWSRPWRGSSRRRNSRPSRSRTFYVLFLTAYHSIILSDQAALSNAIFPGPTYLIQESISFLCE